MMRQLRDIPIRRKLMAIILVTSCIALLLGGMALTMRYAASEQEKMANRMTVLAKVIGANTTAAISFNDPVSAADTLSALAAEPSLIEARVYDRAGGLFTSFSGRQMAGQQTSDESNAVFAGGLIFSGGNLTVSTPIMLDGEYIGRVVLDADLRPLRLALVRDVFILALIMLAACLMALPLASRLQQIVSEPIFDLVRTMRQVSLKKDYNLRAPKHGNDEVGQLIEGFNEMLTQISERDEKLHIAANALENTGDAIIITDAHLKIVSVNKAFSSMTGFVSRDVIGKLPTMLQSDRHSKSDNKSIWRQISKSGQWHGEIWGLRKSGEVFPQWLTISRISDNKGVVSHYVFVSNDISQHKRYEARLEHMAHHDALTGLPNRTLFEAELQTAIQRANRHGEVLGIMFVDLDNFKQINDTLGHAAGDKLLQTVASRLTGCLRECDLVARQGGDEFTVLLDGVKSLQDIATVAEKFITELARPMEIAGEPLSVTASIGISSFPEHGRDAASLLRNADKAMYLAKGQGRNAYCIHTPKDGSKITQLPRRFTSVRSRHH